jgi:hypothetical protein
LLLRRAALLLLAILVVFAQPAFAQPPSEPETQESCHKFVQDFYNWYLTKSLTGKLSRPSSYLALLRKPEAFGPELYRRLKQDREAQDKTPGEIVGLDFDPFLNKPDPVPSSRSLASRAKAHAIGSTCTAWSPASVRNRS